jgi:Flp pilus assembly protein TadB
MSDATDRLARSRQAIIEHIARRERRHDPREEGIRWRETESGGDGTRREPPPRGAGMFQRARHAAGVWWRHHPAHMALEVATPLMANYAARKPVQFIAVAAVAGAALTFARPWRLISLTTLLVAVVKATHLPSVLMSAMSAADFERDHQQPG